MSCIIPYRELITSLTNMGIFYDRVQRQMEVRKEFRERQVGSGKFVNGAVWALE